MNRRQSVFVRELGRTASIIAGQLENAGAQRDGCDAKSVHDIPKGEELLSDAIWKSMYLLRPEARKELSGILRGSAAGDGFEISDWFEQMRRSYGKCSQVLTFCQILCCVFRTGCAFEGAAALRMLSGALRAAGYIDGAPDIIPVWQFMIRHRRVFFGSSSGEAGIANCSGDKDGERDTGRSGEDKTAIFGRMLIQLCCCAGNDRRYAGQIRMIYRFINAYASDPDERERIIEVIHSGALKEDARLFSALEAAYS